MPFGRYRGRRLGELPADYLSWLCGIDLRSPLREDVAAEIRRRQDLAEVGEGPLLLAARQIVDTGYRRLAIQLHPDTGGDAEAMRALNLGAEWLRDTLDRAAGEMAA